MSNGSSARSKWQAQSEAHLKHVKKHPEWMSQANLALKPWGDGTLTLQHAIALALQAAYEAGTRGEYPEKVDYFDVFGTPETEEGKPHRLTRSRPEPQTTQVRIQRTRIARYRP